MSNAILRANSVDIQRPECLLFIVVNFDGQDDSFFSRFFDILACD